MVRLREIPRTAAFTWSPGVSSPYIATGTRAGAVDADFSSDTQLEIWDLELNATGLDLELQPRASITTESRFHDIAWVQPKSSDEKGVIAGALENGSLDIWDASKLLGNQSDALVSQTSKHTGAIKSLQFNPFRLELLATAGTKGELYVSDLNNIGSPFRLGAVAGRADDYECVDWNKKVPHIMVTGSNGGFVTVWDVKTKKESLTLNNAGRKPVSAVAWDPDKPTRLITSVPLDTDPLILVWDLRNSNAPEKVLRGHEGGVLSLSWCPQDHDLLLSCGKDNRTLCWNPQSGQLYGEFPVVTNWTFQTRWSPHNPNLLATASFDGKVAIQTIQNTNPSNSQNTGSQSLDGEDFFNKASTQPQSSSFTLTKAPKWLERPCGATFAFGGKIVSWNLAKGDDEGTRRSTVRISDFTVDPNISKMTESFAEKMSESDLKIVCESHIANASSDTEKNDWKVIETLMAENPRKELVNQLGFTEKTGEKEQESPEVNGTEAEAKPVSSLSVEETDSKQEHRLSSFFDNGNEGDNFLADLASTKGAKTNNPFEIYASAESPADKQITRALLLGRFDEAMELCLAEDRLSDAFMIAICGGQASIDKVQQAYFKKQASGPKYLRLLASVVGKNLWDIVYNADLKNWKEVVAAMCTYASTEEFSDLCESLGDRLEESSRNDPSDESLRKAAAFCFIAGSKLEKVVGLWIADLERSEKEQFQSSSKDTSFSIHAQALQDFIEKVTVFREATRYQDADLNSDGNWKLAPLYEKYTEYADIVASHGQLQVAEKYLELLPLKYPAAEVARNRVKQATRKSTPQQLQQGARQSVQSGVASHRGVGGVPNLGEHPAQAQAPTNNPHAPSNPGLAQQASSNNPYAPPGAIQGQPLYNQTRPNQFGSGGYPSPQMPTQPGLRPMIPPPPAFGGLSQGPPRSVNASPSMAPPSKATSMVNWNDTPEDFFKPPTSRRGTPGIQPSAINAPFPGQQAQVSSPPMSGQTFGAQPPKAGQSIPPPPRTMGAPKSVTPNLGQSQQVDTRTQPANLYTPVNASQAPQQFQTQAQIPRGLSPYNAPPPSAPPPPASSSRYAPAPAPVPQQFTNPPANQKAPPSNPYAARSAYSNSPDGSQGQPGPPQTPGSSGSGTLPAQSSGTAAPVKYPPGDRSHITGPARQIYVILSEDMLRVKSKAPKDFKAQVNDTEKRLNILFDHLNNNTLLKEGTVEEMIQLSEAIKSKDYDRASHIQVDLVTNRLDECGNWMTGIRRLIQMSRATP